METGDYHKLDSSILEAVEWQPHIETFQQMVSHSRNSSQTNDFEDFEQIENDSTSMQPNETGKDNKKKKKTYQQSKIIVS